MREVQNFTPAELGKGVDRRNVIANSVKETFLSRLEGEKGTTHIHEELRFEGSGNEVLSSMSS